MTVEDVIEWYHRKLNEKVGEDNDDYWYFYKKFYDLLEEVLMFGNHDVTDQSWLKEVITRKAGK